MSDCSITTHFRAVAPLVPLNRPSTARLERQRESHLQMWPQTSRLALVTVAVLSFAYLATSFYRLNHTDVWGHLSFGRWIVERRDLPPGDPFRGEKLVQLGVNVPWAAQVVGYLVYHYGGIDGLLLMQSGLVTLAVGIVMLAIRQRGAAGLWCIVGGAVAYLLSLPIVGTWRPQLWGMVAFATTLAALATVERKRHPCLWLPVVFALWTNLHGSFGEGLLLVFGWCVGLTVERWLQRSEDAAIQGDKTLVRAWFLMFSVVGACLLNPRGMWLLVDVVRFANNPILAKLTEWQPLVLASLSGGLYFGSILVTGVLLRSSPRKLRAYEVILLLIFGLQALTALRMLVWWALLWPWLMAPHAAAALGPKRIGERNQPDSHGALRPVLAAAIIVVALIWAPPTHGWIVSQPRHDVEAVSIDTPLYAADELVRQGIAGRIFAPLDWGDYLIWRSHGRLEPIAYTHLHFTPPSAFADFERLDHAGLGWDEVVKLYGLRYFLLSNARHAELYSALVRDSRARVLYQDQQATLLEWIAANDEKSSKPIEPTVSLDGAGTNDDSDRKQG